MQSYRNSYIAWARGPTQPDAAMLALGLAAYWRSFAKYGNPNTAKHPDAPEWPAYTNGTDSNLVFDSPIRTEVGLRKAQCDVCAKYDMCQGRSK